ncbi:MAG: rRNA maturation RNase YbeY [Lachnospiraceae bacterium]|nr:rRNA maturation RNase YbeY [Lachnospiraceae bacterium]
MSVWITCRQSPGFSFHYRVLAESIVQTVLDEESFPANAEVSVLLTDDDEIHQINLEMRGIDAPTDVLSFPMLEYDSPADFSCLDGQTDMYTDPDTGEIPLGDIVLSVDKIHKQAKEYGHSEKREYAFLIVHSMLHLLGYDHMESSGRSVMEERQRQIMDILSIYR